MKSLKNTIAVSMMILASMTAYSQHQPEIKEPARDEFAGHYWMQLQGGAAHTIGEAAFGDLVSPAAALNIGRQFTPAIGVRVGASGWQARGSWVSPRRNYKYSFLQANVDLLLNLSNLLCGWRPQRFFSGYIFVGAGFNHAFDNDEAVAIDADGYKMDYLWTDKKNFPVGRGGIGMNMRLNNHVAVNMEVNANVLSDRFNSKKAGNADWHISGLVGLTITFGKGYRTISPVYEEPIAEPVEMPAAPTPTPEVRRQDTIPTPEVKTIVEPMEQCVFFTINSAKINSAEETKINQLAEYLNRYPEATVSVTGYADKATGTPGINMRLSKKRAEAVVNALVARGVALSRISMDAKGDTVQPFDTVEKNRVSICVATPAD